MMTLYISYDGMLEPLGQSQVIPYLEGLAREGARFVLLSFDKRSFENPRQKQKLYLRLKEANIEWHSLPYHKRPPVLSSAFDILRGLILGVILVKRKKITLLHSRGYLPALIAVFLKKIFRLKFIFDMRGFWADEKAEGNHWGKKSILYKITKRLEEVFIRNADEIVVLTKQAKAFIEGCGYEDRNISVIPCCVDTGNFRLNAAFREEFREKNKLTEKFIFAHTGSLENWYMKSQMLDYFMVAKKISHNAHFLMLSHSPKGEVYRLISEKQLNICDFTIMSIDFSRMPDYLSVADAGIIFLSLGFSKIGCCPTKFSEFLSCGIPVISTAGIGDSEEVIVKHKVGVIVNRFIEGEYRQTFSELLKLKEDANLGSRCHRLSEELFSLNVGTSRYQAVYSRLKNGL